MGSNNNRTTPKNFSESNLTLRNFSTFNFTFGWGKLNKFLLTIQIVRLFQYLGTTEQGLCFGNLFNRNRILSILIYLESFMKQTGKPQIVAPKVKLSPDRQ